MIKSYISSSSSDTNGVCEYSNSYINIPNYQKSVENDIFVLYENNSGAIYSETA